MASDTGDRVITPEEFFAENALGLAAHRRVLGIVTASSTSDAPVEVRITKSQVAFRRRHGFAYLWVPGRYVRRPAAEVVLSIVLGRRDESPRFKEVVHPSPRHWMHHLEINDIADLDEEVVEWLREAADRAA